MSERAPEMAGPEFYESRDRAAKKQRRERIATAVLQGMAMGGRTVYDEHGPVLAGYAARAVQWADALIAELDR